jgi:hypothetical protein
MSRARHHAKKARGGGVKGEFYAGGESNVAKEAEERKHGGRAHHMEGEGEHAKHRGDRPNRARGGKVEHNRHHEARGRKRGGGVGANLTPLSTAAKIKEVTKGEQPEDEGH